MRHWEAVLHVQTHLYLYLFIICYAANRRRCKKRPQNSQLMAAMARKFAHHVTNMIL